MGFLLALAVQFEFIRSFIVPTGSMSPAIFGDHKEVTCPRCGVQFPINASMEPKEHVTECTCFNCRHNVVFNRDKLHPPFLRGDRIFVAGFFPPSPARSLGRYDLIVHSRPDFVEGSTQPEYYVKRLMGMPGDTVAFHYGRLFVSRDIKYPAPDAKPRDIWRKLYMNQDDPLALKQFENGKFQILRRSPNQMIAMRLPVHDNDFSPKDLGKVPRWAATKGGWSPTTDHGFETHPSGDGIDWLRYRHVFPREKGKPKPELITDFFSYNAIRFDNRWRQDPAASWVGDLLMEFQVTLPTTEGELWLELAKGVDRFQARWDLGTGRCTLLRRHQDGSLQKLADRPTEMNKVGTYRVRFANVDERLTVWINETLPFGDGIAYSAPKTKGPTLNDLEPASIGGKNAKLTVRHLQLWRDNYYTANAIQPETELRDGDWADPKKWEPLRHLPVSTLFVQPGHYLVLGDNSLRSSDSRDWGSVPEALIQWRVLLRYYPFTRLGRVQ